MPLKTTSFVFLLIYLFFRMFLDFVFWRGVSPYFAYAFEIIFVVLGFRFLKERTKWFEFSKKNLLQDFVWPLLGGWTVYRLASFSDLSIPFDLRGLETLFLLLVLAPILEETIFRGVLWRAFSNLCKNPVRVLISTTLLFALSHLQAIWFVPAAYRIFVLYQTMYVVLLGLWSGWRRHESDSMSSPILVHSGFNIGFWLGSF